GVISSILGSVNINNPAGYSAELAGLAGTNLNSLLGRFLNINGIGGTIAALNGNINIGGAALPDQTVLNMLGGNYIADVLNIDAGHGQIEASLGTVTGLTNVAADVVHMGTQTPVLQLGSVKVDGDPTFFNIGDINVNAAI